MKLYLKVIPFYLLVGALLLTGLINNTHAATARGQLASLPKASDIQIIQPGSDTPVGIAIPLINIDLPVVKGQFNDSAGTWDVSAGVANYLVDSPGLDSPKGKAIIYGHATDDVFGKLTRLRPGDEVNVTADTSKQYSYKMVSSQVVSPDNTDVLDQTNGNPGLVLITCSGWFSENRLILTFEKYDA